MSKYDRNGVEDLLARADIEDIINSYGVDLKSAGPNEAKCVCPFHEEKTPSFTLTRSNQLYYCFGCGAKGNAINFIMDYESIDFKPALQRLKQHLGIMDDDGREVQKPLPKPKVRPRDPSEDWQAIMPIPATAPKLMNGNRTCELFNPKTGKRFSYQPERVYVYTDSEGGRLGAVLRIMIDDKKLTPTITYCVNTATGEEGWILKDFPKPRPIYNLEMLEDATTVLIVEGEKCVDSAHNALPDDSGYSAIGWPMGTNGVEVVDWSPIYGRDVVLWADNDLKRYKHGPDKGDMIPTSQQAGRKCMAWLQSHLRDNGCNVTLLDQPTKKPDGWDCDDHVADGGTISQYIADHMPASPSTARVPSLPDRKTMSDHNSDIVPLGYDNSVFHYYSKFTQQIRSMKDTDHRKVVLLGLAPEEWWLSGFDNGKGNVDYDAAVSWMMESCRRTGIFENEKIRGRGCWQDSGRTVLHLGDRLVVDGEEVAIGSFNSNYFYQAASKKPMPVDPLENHEGELILKAAEAFDWEMPASSALLAGYCALAPICGQLKWRPHIWVTGGSGSGKTTVYKYFISDLLGKMSVDTTLESSSAGLMQTLKADALPIVFEEFDPSQRKKTDMDRAQGHFNLMRIASDDSEMTILRGSANQEATAYRINSMFCLMGIQIFTDEAAVLNRLAQLALKSRPNKTPEQKKKNDLQWQQVQKTLAETIETLDNVSLRLLARTVKNIEVINHNIKIFRSAASEHLGSARNADVYGTLLAGAYSLRSDVKINKVVAKEYIKQYDWTVYTSDTDEDEAATCLNRILQTRLQVQLESSIASKTVAEWIEEARGNGLDRKNIDNELKRFGIACRDEYFIVANQSLAIRESLHKQGATPGMVENWKKYLARLNGGSGLEARATKNAVSFAGTGSRGIEIPYELIVQGEQ